VVAGAALVLVVAVVNGGAGSSTVSSIASAEIPLASGLADGRTLGRTNAVVTIDEWADFQCPVCQRFFSTIEPSLRATYIDSGSVKLAFHDYAFIGPESVDAAAAARISDAIGPGFWPFHDLLYSNQGSENSGAFSRDRLADLAVSLGMDRSAFLAALDDPSYADAVSAETTAGSQLGINSTPTLVIDGTLYPGLPTWDQLSSMIDQAVARHASQQP
jgi:protein-disulfide isomerase